MSNLKCQWCSVLVNGDTHAQAKATAYVGGWIGSDHVGWTCPSCRVPDSAMSESMNQLLDDVIVEVENEKPMYVLTIDYGDGKSTLFYRNIDNAKAYVASFNGDVTWTELGGVLHALGIRRDTTYEIEPITFED